MLLAKTLSFYKRPEVQKKIIEQATDKEVAIRFSEYFGKRPDMLMYENDVMELAKKKATSFHCSEELWTNPLSLRNDMKKEEVDALRKGWDLILDIDCHHFIYSKLAAHILIKILQEYGIKCVTAKFSGNKGFHLAVPFEAFPDAVNGEPSKNLFPEAPRRIAQYLREKLSPLLGEAIMKVEKNSIQNVSKRTGIETKKLIFEDQRQGTPLLRLNVESFLEIDTILIAPRHLYRMPYSLHEKSMLVSVPVEPEKILKFRKEMAEPENVKFNVPFLDRRAARKGEATKLIIAAYDFQPRETLEKKERKEFSVPEEAIPEELFPPCMKNIFKGLEDGKKRALFTLINFLKGAGWPIDMIEERIHKWNKANPEPLREVYLKGQLRQVRKSKEIVPPHNCKSYYQDLGVCAPDNFCPRIKNPLQYAKAKHEMNTLKEKKKPRLTDEQKEMRRKHRERKKAEKSI